MTLFAGVFSNNEASVFTDLGTSSPISNFLILYPYRNIAFENMTIIGMLTVIASVVSIFSDSLQSA